MAMGKKEVMVDARVVCSDSRVSMRAEVKDKEEEVWKA